VAQHQQRIQSLSKEAVPPLILADALPQLKHVMFGSVALPEEVKTMVEQP